MGINKDLIESLKIAIIYGEDEVDRINRDGTIEKIYKENDDTAHIFYMLDFLKDNFKDSKEIQEAIKKNDVNSIFFEMQKMGHIIFAENTSVPNYKSGIIYIPKQDKISEKQKEELKHFEQKLEKEDYNINALIGLYRSEEGVLMGIQKMGKANILLEFVEKEVKENEKIEDAENER